MRAYKKPNASKWAREVAWDIEATQWRNVVAVCGLSSDGETVRAESFPEYLAKAEEKGWLTTDTRHWAHWGGIYDHILAWEHCAEDWYALDMRAGSGFGLWSADLARGKSTWCLRDSARLMPGSLASIGKAFGLEKLDVDRSNIGLLTKKELFDYCLRDCEVLLKALRVFSDTIGAVGVELRDTIAATASAVVRSRAVPAHCWGWSDGADKLAARAYYGGRVERFSSELWNGAVYDINSSYPAAMSRELPTAYLGEKRRAPAKGWYYVAAKAHVPDVRIPQLPYRGALGKRWPEKLYFPTGDWEGFWAKEEYEHALSEGVKFDVREFHCYESSTWLAEIMGEWWSARARSASEAEKYILKLLMNSISGKLIESPEHERLTENPRDAARAEAEGIPVKLYSAKTVKGTWVQYFGIRDVSAGSLRHAAAAASVLSRARTVLLQGIREAEKTGTVGYCDTDSVFTTGKIESSRELGRFKLETEFECADLLAPKLYALGKLDGSMKIAAKGFRVKGRSESEAWQRIAFGMGISAEATRGFKTGLNKHEAAFIRERATRRPGAGAVDKRCFSAGEIDSRAWSAKELREPWEKR